MSEKIKQLSLAEAWDLALKGQRVFVLIFDENMLVQSIARIDSLPIRRITEIKNEAIFFVIEGGNDEK